LANPVRAVAFQSADLSSSRRTVGGSSGDVRRVHAGDGVRRDLGLADKPAEELLQRAVAVRSRRGSVLGERPLDERLDVFAADDATLRGIPWRARNSSNCVAPVA